MKNNSIDKMAEQFTSVEELQAYCDSQYKTILTLNQKINTQEAELNKLREENARLSIDKAIGSVPNQFSVTDEETICVVQIAILKAHSLERELVSDEVKRLEILTKVLQSIRSQSVKKDKPAADDMSSEELLKQLDGLSKEPQ